MVAVDLGLPIGPVWRAFSGFCLRVPDTRICREQSPMDPPAGGDWMWEEQDVWLRAWSKLLGQLDELLGRCPFWTRLLSPPKKGLAVGTTRHGKGTKCVAVV